MKQYFKENPIKVISFSTSVFGALITFSYFWRIGHLPDLTLDELTPVFISNAILSALISISFISLFTYSGFIWPTNVDRSPIADLWMDNKAVAWKKILLWYGIPVLPVPVAIVAFPFKGWISPLLILFLCLYILYLWIFKYSMHGILKRHFLDYLGHLLFATTLYLPLALVIYAFLIHSGIDNIPLFFVHFTCGTLILWMFNIFLIANPKQFSKNKWWLIISPTAFVLFLITTNTWHLIPAAAMKIQGIGQLSDYIVVVKGDLCATLPADVIANQNQATEPDTKSCTLKPLLALSTLGSNIIVEYSHTTDKGDIEKYHLEIPKQSVIEKWTKI
jgi:hypothetical protein